MDPISEPPRCPGCGCAHAARIESRTVRGKTRERRTCRWCGRQWTRTETRRRGDADTEEKTPEEMPNPFL